MAALNLFFLSIPIFLMAGSTSSSFISGGVFEAHGSTGRSLLQERKSCPVNFEFMNYTIITSQCKGPQYPAKLCCNAFKEFACPYVDELNDVSNDCASIMFSYINLEKYPPGLFSSECREGKEGLECSIAPAQSVNDNANGGQLAQKLPRLLILGVGFLLFQFL